MKNYLQNTRIRGSLFVIILFIGGVLTSLYYPVIDDNYFALVIAIYFIFIMTFLFNTIDYKYNWLFIIISFLYFVLSQTVITIGYVLPYRITVSFVLLSLFSPLYIIPTFFYILYNKILLRYPNFVYVLSPKDNFELEREDNILIDAIGFFQAIIFIYGVVKQFKIYQNLALIGMIGFVFPRIIGHIRNDNKYRYYSSLLLIAFIFIDVVLIVFEPIPNSPLISTFKEQLYIQLDWIIMILLISVLLMILSFFNVFF